MSSRNRSEIRLRPDGLKGTPVSDPPTLPGSDGVGEDYLNHVAHELRASLNTILGWAELLRTRSFDEAGKVRAAETILRHARQQLWLVNDLMDTWRLLSGSLRLNSAPVDLRSIVQSAAQAIDPIANAKDIKIELDLAPVVRDMIGDAHRLKQAVVALLANAVHFSNNSDVVDVRLTQCTEGLLLVVRDRGMGVSSDALPYLFDRRRPSNGAAVSRRGELGVGLGLVRDIINLHGGTIRVESDGSRGVTFTVVLPAEYVSAAVPALAQRSVSSERSHLSPRIRLSGLTVLLVDDEEDAREVVAGILKHYGASVVPVSSVSEALAALKRHRVDVLLTDIAMPGEDGFDLIRRLRQLEPEFAVPAAALTAFASENDRRRSLEAGFQVHLSKPIDPHVLVDAVETLGKRAET